ncbi:MAG: winged helix-turn-helix domain-containing protein, partial [Lentisphaerota bacterium]
MVDKSRKIRLSEQVLEHVLSKIRCREWPPGHRLPGERRLAETLQVSRVTVVEALNRLENKHIIEKIQARGNFVCRSNSKLKIVFPFPEKEIPHGNSLPGEALLLMNELQRGMMCGASAAGVHFFLDFYPDPGNDPDILERYQERLSEFDAIVWGGPQLLRLRERMYGRKPMVVIGKSESYGQEDMRNCSHVYYDWLSAIREL